jgi:hypothetical protein
MKHLYLLLVLTLVLLAAGRAQVTNVVVNGVSANFTFASGSTITWSYNIPPGSSTNIEIWLDLNTNGVIDPASDKVLFTFAQVDGDTNGNGGPPDQDGLANGSVIFSQPVGLAPQHYVMKFTNNGSSATIGGTITPLASPAFTVSGHVTPPAGKSAQYILIEANRNGGAPNFWDGITDGSGNYTIEMSSDTAGNPWRLALQTQFPPNLPTPAETLVVIDGNITGINFGYTAAAAQVAGFLKDENGLPIIDRDVNLNDNSSHFFSARTDIAGFFQVGIPLAALSSQPWSLSNSTNGQFTTTEMQARANLPAINPGDSLFRILTVYKANSTIKGRVLYNGAPMPFSWYVAALADSQQATTGSTPFTGDFTVGVSDKFPTYTLTVWNLPFGFDPPNVPASPGDTGIVLNVTVTSVIERAPGVPTTFALLQNYPNPFNPTTSISYDLPREAFVHLSVYNLLGEEVARLVNEEQHAGKYTASFSAASLPSGIYLYRLTAGGVSSVKKMILMK